MEYTLTEIGCEVLPLLNACAFCTMYRETAKLLNKFPPYLLSIVTTSVSPCTPLETMRDNGTFVECTEREAIEEEKLLLNLLEFDDAYFFGGHNYNLIPINAPLSKKGEILRRLEDGLRQIDPDILDSVYPRASI